MFRAIFIFTLVCTAAHADLEDVQQAEQIKVQQYVERFSQFTQDKNVMGKGAKPDGKKVAGRKSFNPDDGVNFQSDLTYHDWSYEIADTHRPNDVQSTLPFDLPANVSPHGASSQGNGSSVLERIVYQWHKKFWDQDNRNRQQLIADEKKTGIELRSVFEKNKQKLVPQAPPGSGAPPPDPIFEERDKLRAEVKEKVEEAGKNSFDTIERAARDQDKQNDPNALPNLTFLYEAAKRATQALWNSTLANLTQARAADSNIDVAGVPANADLGMKDEGPALAEDSPDCDSWASSRQGDISKIPDPAARQNALKKLGDAVAQCKQVTATSFKAINPQFKTPPNGGKPVLTTGDFKTEKGRQRDYRVQLEMLENTGKNAGDVQSNWKYNAQDSKAAVTLTYDDSAKAEPPEQLTSAEQIELYNDSVKEAASKISDIKSRMPTLKMDAQQILSNQIDPNTSSVRDLNQPTESMYEELGVQQKPADDPLAQNYDALITQVKKNR
jgi:hypothetical protein